MLGQAAGIEVAADDKENVDAKTAITRAQNGDERLAHAHQRMLMGPQHQARGDEPNQIEGVGMLTQRHHARTFIRSRGEAHSQSGDEGAKRKKRAGML